MQGKCYSRETTSMRGFSDRLQSVVIGLMYIVD